MSEQNVGWQVHESADALGPHFEYDDPLTQFSQNEVGFYLSKPIQ